MTSYKDNKHCSDLDFRASKKKAAFITALRDVNTSVDVGKGTTYKKMNAASAEHYLRTWMMDRLWKMSGR